MLPNTNSATPGDESGPNRHGVASTQPSGNVLAIVFALLFPTLVTYAYFVLCADRPAWLQFMTYGAGKTIQFAFPVFWVYVIQSQRPRFTRPNTRGLGLGIAFGGLVLVAMLAVYHVVIKPYGLVGDAVGPVQRKIAGLNIDSLPEYLVMAAFYAIVHSLLEEYYWRWFVFGQLRTKCSVGLAVILSSVGFMTHHVLVLSIYFGWHSPATALFSVSVAIGGAYWAWLYHRSGSLYAPWISHCLVDLAIFLVGYDMVRQQLF